MRLWPGRPSPLGATVASGDDGGVNFALYSEHATAVRLCLFDSPEETRERIAIPLTERTGNVWHGYLPDARPGLLYGYRVDGPWDPERGHRFNPLKVVLDPYARAIGRQPAWHPSLFAFADGTDGDGARDLLDSAAEAPLGVVTGADFDWQDDRRPAVPWHRTVIYELHVKGMTALHPLVPPDVRGTYLGLATTPVIDHLHRLGVTAVELMPIHAHADEQPLVARGLENYWGYNTLNYFAPDSRFATSRSPLAAIDEFKTMVRALHQAGIEVILDVVYNHTAEGTHRGPTLSFRGIDNTTYYRLDSGRPSRYVDWTGTGNTLNVQNPPVRQLVLDSLRYWAEEMHIDGFRFDLATTLGREGDAFQSRAAFFEAIRDDPTLSRLKLIGEPWDVGPEGYQLGHFPSDWSEWNGKFRDAVRRFWRGDAGTLPELATRLAGSRDIYGAAGRPPHSSINFVTAHDGFTLVDLVSFEKKHNEENGEDNRDGESNNLSSNYGAEGPTDDREIGALRERQRRNFLLTLLVAQGVPMISGGDEAGRTQHGNNNAYCHDSPLSWTHWDLDNSERGLIDFVCQLLAIRSGHPLLQREEYLLASDVRWLRPDGLEMTDTDWADPDRRVIGMQLDDALLVFLNASPADVQVGLPPPGPKARWVQAIDTFDAGQNGSQVTSTGLLRARSAWVLRSTGEPGV